MGISQPPKSAIFAPSATCRSCSGERRRAVWSLIGRTLASPSVCRAPTHPSPTSSRTGRQHLGHGHAQHQQARHPQGRRPRRRRRQEGRAASCCSRRGGGRQGVQGPARRDRRGPRRHRQPNEVTKLSSLGATTAPVVVAVCVGKAVESRRARARRRTTTRCSAGRPAPRPARSPGTARSGSRSPRRRPRTPRPSPRARCSGRTPSGGYRVTSTERHKPAGRVVHADQRLRPGQGRQGRRRPRAHRGRGRAPGPRLGQHPAGRPAAGRRSPTEAVAAAKAAGVDGRGARREGAEEGRLRRHPRRRPGLVPAAAAGAA